MYNGIFFPKEGNDVLGHATLWMNLENPMLSEISQIQKENYYMIPLIRNNSIGKFVETKAILDVTMLPGLKETGDEVLMLNGHRLSVWIDEFGK